MTRVKICGITRIEDALHAAQAGADAIGLVFYAKSLRYVEAATAAAIARALPPFVGVVGLFVDALEDYVRAVLERVPLDVLQFHGKESPAYCARYGRPYLKAVRVREDTDLLQCAADYAAAQALLLDAYVSGVPGGTGERFDWARIPAALPKPIVLSGGLTADNVQDAILQVHPWAVDVSSGVEAAPGRKDPAKVSLFIERTKA